MMLKKLRRDRIVISDLAQCRGMMYQIMNKAKANDLIRKNPVRFAEKMRYREQVKRKDAFTAEEVSILMERLTEKRIGLSIRLMLDVDMRTQKLLALKPRHIEPDGSVIRIEQAINMQKETAVVGVSKFRDSYRSIPVPQSLHCCAAALRQTGKKFVWEERNKDISCNLSHFHNLFRGVATSLGGAVHTVLWRAAASSFSVPVGCRMPKFFSMGANKCISLKGVFIILGTAAIFLSFVSCI